MMDKPYVKSEIRDGIARIEFFHPSHNALPGNLLKKLEQVLLEASESDDVILILLKSGGDRTFCAGADFNELLAIKNEKEGKEFFSGFAKVINAIRKNEKIVVGRIHGKAVGGGVGLAAACDISFATKFASIRLSELNIGIGPFVIAPAVERKLGKVHFMNMSLTPTEWMIAEKLQEVGMYSKVFESIDAMDEFIEDYLYDMKQKSPEALSELKIIFWQGSDNWDELMEQRAIVSGKLVLSTFTKKALNK